MNRGAALLLLSMLVSGCRTPIDSADGPGSQTPANPTAADPRPESTEPAPVSGSVDPRADGPGRSTLPGDASPCERLCGGLGECLLADESPLIASGLELECLDLCVNSAAPSDEPGAKQAFLACEANADCGGLRTCVEARWTALAASKKPPPAITEIVVGTTCEDACRWIYTCMYTNQPPGEATLEPGYEGAVTSCQALCPTFGADDLERFAIGTKCLMERCPTGQAPDCWGLIWG